VGIMPAYFDREDYNSNSSVNISDIPEITYLSTTEISVKISRVNMTAEPTIYSITYHENNSSGTAVSGTIQTVTRTTNPFTISGLTPGKQYGISVRAGVGTSYGNYVYRTFGMPLNYSFSGFSGIPLSTTTPLSSKSFLRLSNNSANPKDYAVAYRTFQSITLPEVTSYSDSLPSYISESLLSYSEAHYAFGTRLFFPSIIDRVKQSAGLGFFVDGQGNDGYYILIDSTETAGAVNKKEIKICKVKGGDIRVLGDSQKNTITSLNGVYAGRSYDVDVKVKINLTSIKISAYVNGFLIEATDSNGFIEDEQGKDILNQILKPSKTVALVSKHGEVMFDYIHGTQITNTEYKNTQFVKNMYKGSFSEDYLSTGFGEIVYNNVSEQGDASKLDALDEFGTSVREIRKVSLRYNGGPSYPIKFSTGLNTSAKILGSKVSNFGGEAYVLNNSSTLTPLNDQQAATFYLYGDSISPSGTLEYKEDDLADYINQEPVVFESSWLQNLSDVQALAKWIKNSVVNKGKLIKLSVFGNPFLDPGDIVSVKYAYQGLDGTQKFIVTSVNHSFGQGLETEIICRSL
jgi:hypothetical protein